MPLLSKSLFFNNRTLLKIVNNKPLIGLTNYFRILRFQPLKSLDFQLTLD